MTPRPAMQWTLLALVFLIALAIRVVPGWEAVYGDGTVNFQGGDSYYHLRSIEALIDNFPARPGYDPYALYPKGLNVPTGPLFDYAVATTAMALGAGDPSQRLVENVAAWAAPLFGALLVLPVFLAGRALLGAWAGLMGAAWIAVCSGHTAYYGKLGFADHHVFESLFYALALFALARAVQSGSTAYALAAGAALGCAVLNRPTAAFLGALFGSWAALQTAFELRLGRDFQTLSKLTLIAIGVGWLCLIPAGSGAWGLLPHMAMAGGAGAVVCGWALAAAVREKGWPFWVWPVAIGALAVAGAALVWVVSPFTIHVLIEGFTEALAGGEARLVAEVRSLLRVGGGWSLRPLFVELGPAGFLALPVFAVMALAGVRERSRPLLLVAITGLAFYLLALLQARMAIYAAVNLAVAVGWSLRRLLEPEARLGAWLRAAAIAAVLFVPMAGLAVNLSGRSEGMSAAWRSAMEWMRTQTPDPLGDPSAFERYYPRMARGERFEYPPSAYGVMTWWDSGYWVLARGRRPPAANGTQTGAHDAARFYVSTDPAQALATADELGMRYVIADHTVALIQSVSGGLNDSQFRAMTGWTDTPLRHYIGVYALPVPGRGDVPVLVFYPEYYRSMAARLYLHDGEDYEPKNATTVFSLRAGAGSLKRISSQVTFETYEKAERYVAARPDQDLIIGSIDPFESCVPLKAVEGLELVYDSTGGKPIGTPGAEEAVKIFERVDRGAVPTPALR